MSAMLYNPHAACTISCLRTPTRGGSHTLRLVSASVGLINMQLYRIVVVTADCTVRCVPQSMEQAEGVRLNGTSSSSPPTNGTASLPPTPTSPAQPEPGASKPVPIPGMQVLGCHSNFSQVIQDSRQEGCSIAPLSWCTSMG